MRAARVSVPIALTASIVAVTIALTVGWQILVARESLAFTAGFTAIHWVLVVLGSVFFALIITVLILQAVWLVREIRSNQRQQNFMDAVTHELHTPLASLQLYLDTLRGRPLPEARRHEFLQIMAEDLVRLQRTIDQIIQAARTDVRRARRESVDVAKLLGECADDARERHGLDEDAVLVSVPETVRMRGDSEQLRVAFRNLLDNAVRHAAARSTSRSRARSRRGGSRSCSPTAASAFPPRRSTACSSASSGSRRSGAAAHGLGLGLAIVRNIARATAARCAPRAMAKARAAASS
jgi:signal transduction histidine kinase